MVWQTKEVDAYSGILCLTNSSDFVFVYANYFEALTVYKMPCKIE